MKNGNNNLRTASAVLVTLMAILIFILIGFRSEVTEAKQATATLQREGSDRESRVRVLENQFENIEQSLQEIKDTLKEDRRRAKQ